MGLWPLRERGPADRPHFPHSTLTVTRADGTHFSFDVEVARSMSDQAYGLMFVPFMPASAGMIFPYDPPREVAFWMKNTLIPLDMLFIRPDYTIGHIATNARPGDVTPIDLTNPGCGGNRNQWRNRASRRFCGGSKVGTPACLRRCHRQSISIMIGN